MLCAYYVCVTGEKNSIKKYMNVYGTAKEGRRGWCYVSSIRTYVCTYFWRLLMNKSCIILKDGKNVVSKEVMYENDDTKM